MLLVTPFFQYVSPRAKRSGGFCWSSTTPSLPQWGHVGAQQTNICCICCSIWCFFHAPISLICTTDLQHNLPAPCTNTDRHTGKDSFLATNIFLRAVNSNHFCGCSPIHREGTSRQHPDTQAGTTMLTSQLPRPIFETTRHPLPARQG